MAAVVVALASGGCGGGAPPPSDSAGAAVAEEPNLRTVTFAPELGIQLDSMQLTSGGLYYRDVQPGRGAVAEPGKQVTIAYQAWLPDGTLYEERPSPGGWGPSEFTLGENAPVPGLNEGVAGMRVGGVRRIVVPPDLGYGLVGRPQGVPERSPLIFQVRLRNVSDPG